MALRPIIILAGPTASGKSQLAIAIAKIFDGVIINADAMQIYQELPVLTAQPSPEEQQGIPHQLYGTLQGNTPCSAAKWVTLTKAAIEQADQEGKTPIIVGGTGLYLKSLMEGLSPIPDISPAIREKIRKHAVEIGNPAFHEELQTLDPVMAEKLRPSDTQRLIRAREVLEQTGKSLADWQQEPPITYFPASRFLAFFLHPERSWLYDNCNTRFVKMLETGALQEVKALASKHYSPDLPVMKALGVPELLYYLDGYLTLEEATTTAQQSTRHYAKRQVTWFKHQLKGAHEITYQNAETAKNKVIEVIHQFLLTQSSGKRTLDGLF